MKLSNILSINLIGFLSIAYADITTTSCQTIPANSLETTPYSVISTTGVMNGKTVNAVIEYYHSVIYSSLCDGTPPTVTHSTETMSVF